MQFWTQKNHSCGSQILFCSQSSEISRAASVVIQKLKIWSKSEKVLRGLVGNQEKLKQAQIYFFFFPQRSSEFVCTLLDVTELLYWDSVVKPDN